MTTKCFLFTAKFAAATAAGLVPKGARKNVLFKYIADL
jgi:hypothetical protein